MIRAWVVVVPQSLGERKGIERGISMSEPRICERNATQRLGHIWFGPQEQMQVHRLGIGTDIRCDINSGITSVCCSIAPEIYRTVELTPAFVCKNVASTMASTVEAKATARNYCRMKSGSCDEGVRSHGSHKDQRRASCTRMHAHGEIFGNDAVGLLL